MSSPQPASTAAGDVTLAGRTDPPDVGEKPVLPANDGRPFPAADDTARVVVSDKEKSGGDGGRPSAAEDSGPGVAGTSPGSAEEAAGPKTTAKVSETVVDGERPGEPLGNGETPVKPADGEVAAKDEAAGQAADGGPAEKAADGAATEKALNGEAAGKIADGKAVAKAADGEGAGKAADGEGAGKAADGAAAGKSDGGAAVDKVGDGKATRRRGKRKSGSKPARHKTPKAPRVRVAYERDFYPVLGWRLLIIDLLGPVILAGIAALIALPYFHVADKSNSTAEIKFFSPPLWSLLIGPAESRIWGSPHAGARASLGWAAEMSLLPGFVLYALALAGLWFSVWKFSRRIVLIIALAASIVLTLGTHFFAGHWIYLPLFGHLPASLGQRIPGRMMLWVTLLLGILAAGAVAEFVRRAEHWSAQRIPPWPAWWLRLATLVPLILVVAEGWNTTAHPVVPAQPASMRTVTSPMLVLPTGAVTDGTVMLWSTTRYQKIANGSGGFAAARQDQMRTAVASFPDATSIDYLRSNHITTVLLVRSQAAGDTPVDSLGITREDVGDTVIFHLG